jgi:N-formylglutamate amidohydrolase
MASGETSRALLPPWVVLHVPHDSTFIPPEVRPQFLLTDDALQEELLRMTDHLTHALFATGTVDARVVRAPVSRLVVDVERFANDEDEPMAARGMGAIYRTASSLAPLRRPLSDDERASLMSAWYHPHHERLERAVAAAVEQHGQSLVLDCHSFPSRALPYEQDDASLHRPDICIGTDALHTTEALVDAFTGVFAGAGWIVAVNQPFAGAMVPASRHLRDRRVRAVMVEVNRRLYLHEDDATPRRDFEDVAARIRSCCARAIEIACF